MKLEECFEIFNGKGIKINISGKYPIYGSAGILGYSDNFLVEGENILVGRVGNAGSIKFIIGKCWVTDNTFIFKTKKNIIKKYAYYLLNSINLKRFSIGSTQPLLTKGILNSVNIDLHNYNLQQHIVNTILILLLKFL